MRDNPLVSILINNFNYARYLREAIDSALGQSYTNIEVIVVDDGSTDNSREIIAGYGERIVPVLKENGGQGSAFNAGFVASRGDIVCFLDSDDVFFPQKVERVVEVLGFFPDAVWVRHTLILTDEGLQPIAATRCTFREPQLLRARPGTYLEDKGRFVISSGIAVQRKAAMQFLPIPEGHVSAWRYYADAYVGFWGTVTGACCSIDEPLAYYRRPSHQHSPSTPDLIRWFEGQIRMEERLSHMWSERAGSRRTASDVYKHSLIVASLRGQSRLAPARCTMWFCGVRETATLSVASPGLALRQMAALTVALVAPGTWLTHFRRALGLNVASVGDPTGDATPGVHAESSA